MNLGDHFPQSHKDKFAKSNLKPLSVIKCNTPFNKIKRFIIVFIDSSIDIVGIVYINTEINYNVNKSSLLVSLHIPLDLNNHNNIIDHNCYIDCSKIYQRTYSGLLDIISNDVSSYLGELKGIPLANIKNKVKTSPKTSKKEMQRFNL